MVYKNLNNSNVQSVRPKFYTMKVALVVLAILGSAFAASLDNGIPPFKNIEVDPIQLLPETEPGLRIINGNEVVPHSIPYQIYLQAKDLFYTWSCGGSLITTRFVLTAAHCVDGARSVSIKLGAHDLRRIAQGEVTINAANWLIHERYNPNTVDNDIAVIQLQTPVQLSATIGLSILPFQSDVGQSLVGANARVSGWGLTSGNGVGSDVLREVNATVISNVLCNQIFGIVQPQEICVRGEGGRSACNGDSGGPLVVGNTQVGIVSYGVSGCLSGFPSVYARVSEFLPWIQTNTDWRSA